jgi:hypothetical protein
MRSTASRQVGGYRVFLVSIDRSLTRAGLISLGLAVAACSGSGLSSGDDAKKPSLFARPDWASFTGVKSNVATGGPIGPEELISAEGACAGMVPAPAGEAQAMSETESSAAASAPQPLMGGIALGMTECEVARRAGTPENVDVGTNERGERAVTLTYSRGSRPGIYKFADGRLRVIERVAEAEPEKPKKPAKPKPAKRPERAKLVATPRGDAPTQVKVAPKPAQASSAANATNAPWPAPAGPQAAPAWPAPPPPNTTVAWPAPPSPRAQ